jgi:hypothetical protein
MKIIEKLKVRSMILVAFCQNKTTIQKPYMSRGNLFWGRVSLVEY